MPVPVSRNPEVDEITDGPASWATAGLGARAAGGLDVLVDVEGVVRVVAALDLGEPGVVAAVGGLDALLALAHHEVDVAAACRGRVQRLPVVPRPVRDEAGVGGIGVDAHDDAGETAVAIGEGRGVGGRPASGPVDGVHVHGRVAGRQQRAVLDVHVDRRVGDLV